jgi:hypothetical protein
VDRRAPASVYQACAERVAEVVDEIGGEDPRRVQPGGRAELGGLFDVVTAENSVEPLREERQRGGEGGPSAVADLALERRYQRAQGASVAGERAAPMRPLVKGDVPTLDRHFCSKS